MSSEEAMAECVDQSFRFVRLLWCDASGVRRCRVVPAGLLKRAEEVGVGLAQVCQFLPCTGDECIDDPVCGPAEEVRIVPAAPPATLPWYPAHALALVDMHHPPSETPATEQGRVRPY